MQHASCNMLCVARQRGTHGDVIGHVPGRAVPRHGTAQEACDAPCRLRSLSARRDESNARNGRQRPYALATARKAEPPCASKHVARFSLPHPCRDATSYLPQQRRRRGRRWASENDEAGMRRALSSNLCGAACRSPRHRNFAESRLRLPPIPAPAPATDPSTGNRPASSHPPSPSQSPLRLLHCAGRVGGAKMVAPPRPIRQSRR